MQRLDRVSASAASGSIHDRLLVEHARLDASLERLLAAYRTGDREAAAEAFGDFEDRLTDHFDLEERAVFPTFAEHEPREAAELLAEHAAIRARLEELGVGVDLHATRLGAIEGLAQLLREHAAREDRLLYPWADRTFSDPALRPYLDTFLARRRSPARPEVP